MLALRFTPLVFTSFLLASDLARGQTVFVDADLTTGASDGSSWSNALQGSAGLRAAFDQVQPGGEIWITEGTYFPSDVVDANATFVLATDDVTIRGGFRGVEDTPLERPPRGESPTVLDGDVAGNDAAGLFLDNCDTVVLLLGASPTLDRVDVVRSGAFGVGIAALMREGDVRIQDCSVRDARAVGLSVVPVSTGPASVEISDCHVEGSAVFGFRLSGGDGTTRFDVERCVSANNQTGFFLESAWPRDTVLRNCIARDNREYGVRFLANEPDEGALVQGSTLANNALRGLAYEPTADTMSPGITVRNSILWGNGGPGAGALEQFEGEGVGPQLIFSSIVQGATPSGSLYAFDPLFVDAANGDYALQSASPAIDRGDGAIVDEGELDVVRRHRAVDIASVPNLGPSSMDAVDIGAFEFSGAIGDNAGCAAELNSTGRAGRLFAEGSVVASSNDFALRADRLPPGQFGLFLASQQRGFAPMTGGSGTLCLGGAIGRFNGAGQIQASSTEGTLDLDVDLTAVPQPASFAAVQPGETWVFQLWHRDVVAPVGATSQFTGVAAVRFD
ncbi:MAG: right-handed parallel beta-helix repeat-containing protein [Planctomycetota bacterium]